MPLTPLHTLTLLWIYLRSPRRVDPAALIASTSIIDLESAAGIVLHRPHGVWHSYLGAALASIPIAISLYMLERRCEGRFTQIFNAFSLPFHPPYSFKSTVITATFGGVSHVLLDSLTHRSFPNALFPFKASPNPFWLGFESAWIVYTIVSALSLYSLICWYRYAAHRGGSERTAAM